MKFLRAFVVAAVALCCTRSVAAQDVTITFHGTISDGLFSPFPDVHEGAPFAGAFTYSMSTPDTNPSDGVGDYHHKGGHYGVTVTIGSHTFHTDRFNTDFLVELVNDFRGEDSFRFISYNNSPSNGFPVSMIAFQLDDFSMTAMNDTSLTGSPPDPARFDQEFGLTVWGPQAGTDRPFFARGAVDSMQIGEGPYYNYIPPPPTGMGPTGPQGEGGPQGPQGASGQEGPQGLPGAQGAAGTQGERGDQGATGPQGPAGPQGVPGVPGSPGASGPQGLTGPIGPAGPQGTQGLSGAAGPVGPLGEGLFSGSLLMMPIGRPAPAGYDFVGTYSLASAAPPRGTVVNVDLYRRR